MMELGSELSPCFFAHQHFNAILTVRTNPFFDSLAEPKDQFRASAQNIPLGSLTAIVGCQEDQLGSGKGDYFLRDRMGFSCQGQQLMSPHLFSLPPPRPRKLKQDPLKTHFQGQGLEGQVSGCPPLGGSVGKGPSSALGFQTSSQRRDQAMIVPFNLFFKLRYS